MSKKGPRIAKYSMSLFSGAGGDSLGMKRGGYTVRAFSEFKKPAIATHLVAFPDCPLLVDPETESTDINKIPDEVFLTYQNKINVLFAGFPCFVKGTLVLTNTGYKEIQTVQITDTLLTHTGTFQKIVNIQQKSYTGAMYDLKLKYHPEFISATEEHPFYVRKKVKQWNSEENKYDIHYEAPEWKKVSELTFDHYVGMVINQKEIDRPFYSPSDGSSERIPDWVHDAPLHLIKMYLKGYTNDLPISTSSLHLAYDLQRLYLKLGILSEVEKTDDMYHVRQHDTNDESSFIEGQYAWYAPFMIASRLVEKEPVYNFEVETDNSYIVQNAIVHNCQGFSHGGKKKMDDPRNELVHQFVRAARLIQPQYIIGENVLGLLSRSGKDPTTGEIRPVIDIIRDLFAGIGYHITYRVLKATDAGVPQERKRLIIVGTKAEKGYPHMPWDDLVEPTSVKHDNIRSFLETHLEGAVEFPPQGLPQEASPHYWITTTETEAKGTPHPNLLRLAGGIRNRSTKEKEKDGDDSSLVVEGGLISFGVRKSGYHGQILDPDKASKTIICTYGVCPRLFVGLYNQAQNKYWVRCLSINELAQIQGFPIDHPWQGNEKDIITQIGNAVPPRLCEKVVLSLPKIIYKDVPQRTDKEEEDDEEEE
jgi:DNA (cytosine-5)-methyltransferase 1